MPLDPLRSTNTEHSGLPDKRRRIQSPAESYIQHQNQALIRVILSGLLEEEAVGLGSAVT